VLFAKYNYKSKRMRRTGHIKRMGERMNAFMVFGRKSQMERDQ
jgi:hypothetical protein